MKQLLFTLLFFGFSFATFSQEIWFDLRGTYGQSVKKEVINTATSMKDINSYYPSSWITASNYISTEITTNNNGETSKAVGTGEVLSAEQQAILAKADFFTDVSVEVKYKLKNYITENIDLHTMNFSLTAVPEIEAEYKGGYEQMRTYLSKAAIQKIAATNVVLEESIDLRQMQAAVQFIVDEKGQVTETHITKTSTNDQIDQLLLESIKNMERWTPAQRADGSAIKQTFEFTVGMGGC